MFTDSGFRMKCFMQLKSKMWSCVSSQSLFPKASIREYSWMVRRVDGLPMKGCLPMKGPSGDGMPLVKTYCYGETARLKEKRGSTIPPKEKMK